MFPLVLSVVFAAPDAGVDAGARFELERAERRVSTTTDVQVVRGSPVGVDAGVWDERSKVVVFEGTTQLLALARPVSRLSVTDASVCDVSTNGSSLQLIAKKPGVVTVLLWRGAAMKGLQVEVKKPVAAVDAGSFFFTWNGEQRLTVPRDVEVVVQGPGGLERVAPGSHRRCSMRSLGNDQLGLRCAEAGAVTVFLWYANNRLRPLELDVGP